MQTIVKANYVKFSGSSGGSAGARKALGRSADYYASRPGEREERRQPFNEESYSIIKGRDYVDEAEGDYAYRMVMSPGVEEEDAKLSREELQEWTRNTMEEMECNSWIGYVHDDHTEHAHVHVIAFTDEKMDPEDFEDLREKGDKEAAEALEKQPELEKDNSEEHLKYVNPRVVEESNEESDNYSKNPWEVDKKVGGEDPLAPAKEEMERRLEHDLEQLPSLETRMEELNSHLPEHSPDPKEEVSEAGQEAIRRITDEAREDLSAPWDEPSPALAGELAAKLDAEIRWDIEKAAQEIEDEEELEIIRQRRWHKMPWEKDYESDGEEPDEAKSNEYAYDQSEGVS